MVSMTIRDVAQGDRDRVAAKAAEAGKSLQEYLLALVHEDAQREDPWQLLERHRAALRSSGDGTRLSAAEVVELVREARADR